MDCSFTRTNNPAEIFNKKLNSLVGIREPRISFLVNTFALILKDIVKSFVASIGSPKKDEKIKREKHFEFIIKYEEIIDKLIRTSAFQEFMTSDIIRGADGRVEYDNDIPDWFYDEEDNYDD